MKKTIFIGFILALMSLTLLSGRGQTGEKVTEGTIIPVDQLDEISTSSSWDLTIEEGGQPGELVIVSVQKGGWVDYRGGKLALGVEPRMGFNFTRNQAILRVPRLSAELRASSSSEIRVNMDWQGDLLSLDSSSSGTISLQNGTAQRTHIRASSSGRISLGSLYSDLVSLKGSSSGRITLAGGETLSLESGFSSSSRLLAEKFLVKESLDVQGSSSSFQEFSINDNIEAQGSLSSSSRLVLHGNPPARVFQAIGTSSGGRLEIK